MPATPPAPPPKGTRRGGRPKGKLNKATIEIKAFADSIIDEPGYRENLRDRIWAGKADHMETLLHHYRSGKPKLQVDIGVSDSLAAILDKADELGQ